MKTQEVRLPEGDKGRKRTSAGKSCMVEGCEGINSRLLLKELVCLQRKLVFFFPNWFPHNKCR